MKKQQAPGGQWPELPWSDPSSCKRPLRVRTRASARVTARTIEYRTFRHTSRYETELYVASRRLLDWNSKFKIVTRPRRSCPQQIRARLVGRTREATAGSVVGARKRCGDGQTQTAGTPNLVVGASPSRLETKCRTKESTWYGRGPCNASSPRSFLRKKHPRACTQGGCMPSHTRIGYRASSRERFRWNFGIFGRSETAASLKFCSIPIHTALYSASRYDNFTQVLA